LGQCLRAIGMPTDQDAGFLKPLLQVLECLPVARARHASASRSIYQSKASANDFADLVLKGPEVHLCLAPIQRQHAPCCV
jgi:hypothetical protein